MWPFRRQFPHPSDNTRNDPSEYGNQPSPEQPNPPNNNYDWPFSVKDERIMHALAKVPRDRFIPEAERNHAKENRALPIGLGQTISQPYIVALMTELLVIKPNSRILEVGTGSGYQCAILAELSNHIYTVEIIPDLAHKAQETLRSLGYDKIHYLNGDGALGWPEEAPFNGIIVTCVSKDLPIPLWEQLTFPDGRLVIPVGTTSSDQQLVLYRKNHPHPPSTNYPPDSPPTPELICPVRFVPMTHNCD